MLNSNPVRCFVTGSKQKSYTFKPGKYPFYAVLDEESWIPLNVLLFADSKEHTKKILENAFYFMKKCAIEFKENTGDEHRCINMLSQANFFIKKLNDIQITRIVLNQLFKVGWAENDTI